MHASSRFLSSRENICVGVTDRGRRIGGNEAKETERRNLKWKVVGNANVAQGVRAGRRALVQMGALTARGMGVCGE